MNKMKFLKVINFILFFVLIAQALTILVMLFDLNIVNPHYLVLIHKVNGLFLIVLVIFHIALNWTWLKSTYFKKA